MSTPQTRPAISVYASKALLVLAGYLAVALLYVLYVDSTLSFGDRLKHYAARHVMVTVGFLLIGFIAVVAVLRTELPKRTLSDSRALVPIVLLGLAGHLASAEFHSAREYLASFGTQADSRTVLGKAVRTTVDYNYDQFRGEESELKDESTVLIVRAGEYFPDGEIELPDGRTISTVDVHVPQHAYERVSIGEEVPLVRRRSIRGESLSLRSEQGSSVWHFAPSAFFLLAGSGALIWIRRD